MNGSTEYQKERIDRSDAGVAEIHGSKSGEREPLLELSTFDEQDVLPH